MRFRMGYVVRGLSACSMIWLPMQLAAADNLSPWWATDCEFLSTSAGEMAFAVFRKFPVTNLSADYGARRKLTVDARQLTVSTEQGKTVVLWKDIKSIEVKTLGKVNSGYELSLITVNGRMLREPFGIVELSCLRKLESVTTKYAEGIVVGAPPPADIRVAPGVVDATGLHGGAGHE